MSTLQQYMQRGEALLREGGSEKEQAFLSKLEQVTLQLEDLTQDVRDHEGSSLHDMENGSLNLEDLEQRWYQLKKLQKKYGTTSKEILETLQKISKKNISNYSL